MQPNDSLSKPSLGNVQLSDIKNDSLSARGVQLCKPPSNVETHTAEFRYPVENYKTSAKSVRVLTGHHVLYCTGARNADCQME